MADKLEYTVNRSMLGDKSYERGDTRMLTEADAAPLLASGALSVAGEAPVAREPAVVHAFGQAPTPDRGYTSALTGKVVSSSTKGTFDHDGDGAPGGSKAGTDSTASRGAAKRKA